jgi:capsular polysaccharide biosynthesis protein
LISRVPDGPTQPFFTYDGYYNWLASEYVVDDYTQIVTSRQFANDVSAKLASKYHMQIPPQAVQGAISAERTHRILKITVKLPNFNEAISTGQAVGDTVSENGMKYFGQSSTDKVSVSVLDSPDNADSGRANLILNLLLRVVLGVAVGVGLTFLLEYLDDTVRGPHEVEQLLGLPVVGTIPPLTKSSLGGPRTASGKSGTLQSATGAVRE